MLDGKESCLYKNTDGDLKRGFCREILDYDEIRKYLADKMKTETDSVVTTQNDLSDQVKLLEIENNN